MSIDPFIEFLYRSDTFSQILSAQGELSVNKLKPETTSIYNLYSFDSSSELMYIFTVIFVVAGILFYKFKFGNRHQKHPYEVYQEAEYKAKVLIQKGDYNQAVQYYKAALEQIQIDDNQEDFESPKKQTAWILGQKIEELSHLEGTSS
ncbi:hypothetical protein KIH41_05995 [Litoribacter ruber]|uniref:Tetratricopeptide repeat protein n=1 Tax=Litoribacter ruber TaxID=702568 RepID=A0AAP2CFI3_9BACT|nr:MULTISPECIES: hypothetical protein [Litoribacter]MBS9523007.1 hypothetical protein [Litoribacter alkaliphilus]MBT0810829.1 hypothetical protein [Litoribacter ruber]